MIIRNCEICEKEMRVSPVHSKSKRFCSRICRKEDYKIQQVQRIWQWGH